MHISPIKDVQYKISNFNCITYSQSERLFYLEPVIELTYLYFGFRFHYTTEVNCTSKCK